MRDAERESYDRPEVEEPPRLLEPDDIDLLPEPLCIELPDPEWPLRIELPDPEWLLCIELPPGMPEPPW